MATATKVVTIDDVARLPDDGCRYDLIGGRLVCMSPAGGEHGRVAGRIARRIGRYLDEHPTGDLYVAETGFVLARDPDTLLSPDVAFVRTDRQPADQRGFLPLPPDLAVEVASPSDRENPLFEKVMQYLDHGVRLVWVVQPSRKLVTVWTPDRSARTYGLSETLDGGEVLPGLQVPVDDLFS